MKIGIYGGGNVAAHLIPAFNKVFNAIYCFNRTKNRLEEIVKVTKSKNIRILQEPNFADIDIDFLILMVSDKAIISALKSTKYDKNTIIIHISGGTSLDILQPYADNYGVLYPLQTFTKGVRLNVNEIPFIIQGSDINVLNKIEKVTGLLSQYIYKLDDDQKKMLHIAAVFACNFANHCWVYAAKLLSANDIPFEIIKPLIKQTLFKALNNKPEDSQTGPAVRGDIKTIEQHRQILEENRAKISINSDVIQLYDAITKDIIDFYNVQ